MKGWTAADIIREGAPEGLAPHWPSDRTIQNLVKRFRPASTGEWWTLTPDEDDPAPILKAIHALIVTSEGRLRRVTVEEARWIQAVHRADPGLNGYMLIATAWAYISAHRQGIDPTGLDHILAFGPRDRSESFVDVDLQAAGMRGWIARVPNEVWFPKALIADDVWPSRKQEPKR